MKFEVLITLLSIKIMVSCDVMPLSSSIADELAVVSFGVECDRILLPIS